VKYAKGNVFLDERGRRHRIAELCGHQTEDPTGGVTFIEASWVASPAFTGAVMRNIISPEALNARTAQRVKDVLSSPPPQWVEGGERKAASSAVVDAPVQADFDFGTPEEGGGGDAGGGGEAKPAEPVPPTKFDELEDRILQTLVDRIDRRVQDEVSKKEKAKEPNSENSTARTNDNLQASRVARTAYAASAMAMIRTASSDADLVNKIAILDESFGVKASIGVYRAVLTVGSMSKFSSTESYLSACRDAMGRAVGLSEGRALLRLGRILTNAESVANRSNHPPDEK
jgi:hypothetical protein